MIFFSAPIEPVPFSRPAQNGRRRFNNQRYSEFKDSLAFFAHNAMRGRDPFTGAIKITVNFFKPRPKKSKHCCGDFAIVPSFGDVDNLLKAVLDSLNGICYEDDSQVVEVTGTKSYGEPRVLIELEEVR